jgi:hypothetical protein
MKKVLVLISLLFSLAAKSQVPFSSLTLYTGNLDSVKYVGLLKSGSVWANRVFYGIDLVKLRLLLSDTATMLAPYARSFNYYTISQSDARYELLANKATSLASPDNTKYPTTLAITSAGYITGNQTISWAPTGDVTGSTTGTTSLAPVLSIGTGKVTNAMLAGSIAFSKLVGSDITLTESQVTNLVTDLSGKGAITTVATALTAAGTNQGTALALSGNNSVQEVTTAASGTGVKLPTATATSRVAVINRGANDIIVYPNTSGVINAQSANAGFTIPASASAVFIGKDGTSWYMEQAMRGGDVSNSDASKALTINANAVTNAKLAQMTANTLKGNNTAGTANALDLTTSQVKTLLALDAVENTALSTWTGSTNFTTLANNAVSYAEMQDVSATQRVIGRNTAGAGDPEEVTVSQVLDWISTTQGAVLYRNATTWVALAPGTSGQVLQSGGASANPSWTTIAGGGDMVLASVQTVTGAKTFNAGTLILAAGTSTLTPLSISSGTDVSNPTNGSFTTDFDGYVLKATTRNSTATAGDAERGYFSARQLVVPSGTKSIAGDVATAQDIFASGQASVKLSANTTYRFEAVYLITNPATTAHTIQTLFTYSGTMASFLYWANGIVTGVNSNASGQSVYVNRLTATSVTTSVAAANSIVRITGTCRTSTTGLLKPQFQFSVAPGGAATTGTIDIGTYFEIWPVGSDTVQKIGSWQ